MGDRGLIKRIDGGGTGEGSLGVRDGAKRVRSIKVGGSVSGEQLVKVLHAPDVDGMTEVNGTPLWKL